MGYVIGYTTPDGQAFIDKKTVYNSFEEAQRAYDYLSQKYPEVDFKIIENGRDTKAPQRREQKRGLYRPPTTTFKFIK